MRTQPPLSAYIGAYEFGSRVFFYKVCSMLPLLFQLQECSRIKFGGILQILGSPVLVLLCCGRGMLGIVISGNGTDCARGHQNTTDSTSDSIGICNCNCICFCHSLVLRYHKGTATFFVDITFSTHLLFTIA